MIHRRQLLTGLISLVAAPAIVRASSLMPVKAMPPDDLLMKLGTIYGVEYDVTELIEDYKRRLVDVITIPAERFLLTPSSIKVRKRGYAVFPTNKA